MPTGTLQIRNNTSFVPTIENVALTGCNWLFTQELDNGTPIAAGSIKQGTVELPGLMWSEYEIALTVHFYGLGPGVPVHSSHDVNIECGREQIGNDFVANYGTTGDTPAVLDIEFNYHLDASENDIFFCTISGP